MHYFGKVKDLLLLPNTELMTTKMVADYYEVSVATLNTYVVQANKDELISDGAFMMKGKEFVERYKDNLCSVKAVQTGVVIKGFDKITFRGQ